jgi:uncharacterized YccA/Bax inhibitor family protein
MWTSSNPVLTRGDKFQEAYGELKGTQQSEVTTLQGVINKTAILTVIAVVAGAGGFSYFTANPGSLWIGFIAAFVITIGIYFVIFGNPRRAPYLAPVYAIVEGFFLGGFTAFAEYLLASRGLSVAGGVALQAFIVTVSVLLAMLGLYSSRIIRPTGTFMSIMAVAAGAVGVMYMLGFMLMLFGIRMPYIFISSTMETGTAGYIGLGINLLFLGIASFMLIFDFKLIEDKVKAGSPKYMEWFCGFALLVTLAWIYLESVKLVLRVAVLFGRD